MSKNSIPFGTGLKSGSLTHWGLLLIIFGGAPRLLMSLLGNDPSEAAWGRFALAINYAGGALIVLHWFRRACRWFRIQHNT